MNQRGFINIIVIIGVVILAGIAGYFVLSQRTAISPEPIPTSTLQISTSTTPITDSQPSLAPTPTNTQPPTTNVSNKTNSENLVKALEQLDSFPQQPCPNPTGRYHTERYVYVRTTAEGIPILHYPGTNVRMMTKKVQGKINALPVNTVVDVFYYEVYQFAPTSGADSEANNTIWCFNLVP